MKFEVSIFFDTLKSCFFGDDPMTPFDWHQIVGYIKYSWRVAKGE